MGVDENPRTPTVWIVHEVEIEKWLHHHAHDIIIRIFLFFQATFFLIESVSEFLLAVYDSGSMVYIKSLQLVGFKF